MYNKVDRAITLESLSLEAKGLIQEAAANAVGISRSTLERAKAKQRLHGDIEGGALKKGRKNVLSAGMEDVPYPPVPNHLFDMLNDLICIASYPNGHSSSCCLFVRVCRGDVGDFWRQIVSLAIEQVFRVQGHQPQTSTLSPFLR